MDNHKKFKKPDRRPGSLDGIVTDGRQLGVPAHRSYQPSRERTTPSLDNLISRRDGFHPLRQSQQSLGTLAEQAEKDVLLNEPIVLDGPADGKKHKKRRPRVRKVLKRAGLVLAATVLIGGGYFGVKLYLTQKNLFRGGGKSPALSKCAEVSELKKEGDCRVNILLLGTGGERHAGSDLTDTIMVVSIDPINQKASMLSIPRDLCTKLPCSGNQKLNAVYALAKQNSKGKSLADKQRDGAQAIDNMLESILGVPIHYNVLMSFNGFKQAVDAVGGVTVEVPERLYDPTIAWENNGNPIIAQKGTQKFNGAKALLYVKSRETSSDFARAERQRLVLVALKNKALSGGTFANPARISNLLSSLGNNIYTDFELDDIRRLQKAIEKIPSDSINSLDLVTEPNVLVTTANLNGVSIVQPKAGLFEYDAIQAYVRTAFKDAQIARENSSIAVYNATSNVGLAAKKADELKSYGYNITTVDNARITDPATTVIVDLTKGSHKYTRHYLESRFGVTTRTTMPPEAAITPPTGTNFVIILGEDAATTR